MNPLNNSQLHAADVLWDHYQRGADISEEAFSDLDFGDGLAIQNEIRQRRLANGATQIGWKVGLTSDRARKQVGIDDRPFGHLMQLFDSGQTLPASSVNGATIEPEMCFTIGETISGPDVDPATVAKCLETVAAGYDTIADAYHDLAKQDEDGARMHYVRQVLERLGPVAAGSLSCLDLGIP